MSELHALEIEGFTVCIELREGVFDVNGIRAFLKGIHKVQADDSRIELTDKAD